MGGGGGGGEGGGRGLNPKPEQGHEPSEQTKLITQNTNAKETEKTTTKHKNRSAEKTNKQTNKTKTKLNESARCMINTTTGSSLMERVSSVRGLTRPEEQDWNSGTTHRKGIRPVPEVLS